jgi:hypothetical protein
MVSKCLVPSVHVQAAVADGAKRRSTRRLWSVAAVVPIIVSAAAITAGSAGAATKPFGCTHEGRSISATVFYAEANAGTFSVDRIQYNYANSGGGKSNTNFRVNNGAGTPVFTWASPDNRDDGTQYSKQVDTLVSKGNGAAAQQTTFFDTAGNDPQCSGSGHLS